MQFEQVIFYGRGGHQGLAMFNLDPAAWAGRRVLDCPGGPGSLPAVLRAAGVDVTAVDPLYGLDAEGLAQRSRADLDAALATMASSPAIRPDFDLAACRREHEQALEDFLADRAQHPDCYLNASLPELPFPDGHFDLVLCGHLLFSYAPRSDGGLVPHGGFDLDWHRRALAELLRVSREAVRLYPAHTMERQAKRHPYAEALLAHLPPGWRGRFAPSRYDQGHEGITEALELERVPFST